jgi:hypothetical protein
MLGSMREARRAGIAAAAKATTASTTTTNANVVGSVAVI